MTATCALCNTSVEPGQEGSPLGTPEGPGWAHRECLLRSVLGGIGHLTNHAYWCGHQNDPDGGMSFRESALAVDAWVHAHGIKAATKAAVGPDKMEP